MSAKCKWCHRKRPEVTIELDDRLLDVCSNCKRIIQGQGERTIRDEAADMEAYQSTPHSDAQ